MNAAAFVQVVILATAGVACLLVVARKIAPASMRRVQAALARFFAQPTRVRPLRAFGAWLQPRDGQAGHCGSGGGGGCSSCGGCAGAASSGDGARPLEFVRKPASRTR